MFGNTINLGKHTSSRGWGFAFQRKLLNLGPQTLLVMASGALEGLVAAMLLHVKLHLV